MVISSLVVECLPDKTASVADELRLRAATGIEVHDVIDGCRIVITVEAPTTAAAYAATADFVNIPGVVNTNLVYNNFEDEVGDRTTVHLRR